MKNTEPETLTDEKDKKKKKIVRKQNPTEIPRSGTKMYALTLLTKH